MNSKPLHQQCSFFTFTFLIKGSIGYQPPMLETRTSSETLQFTPTTFYFQWITNSTNFPFLKISDIPSVLHAACCSLYSAYCLLSAHLMKLLYNWYEHSGPCHLKSILQTAVTVVFMELMDDHLIHLLFVLQLLFFHFVLLYDLRKIPKKNHRCTDIWIIEYVVG